VALDLLADLFAFAHAVGNLQVAVDASGFDAEKHGASGLGLPPSNHIPRANATKKAKTAEEFALHF
jgi:hypothetical protein